MPGDFGVHLVHRLEMQFLRYDRQLISADSSTFARRSNSLWRACVTFTTRIYAKNSLSTLSMLSPHSRLDSVHYSCFTLRVPLLSEAVGFCRIALLSLANIAYTTIHLYIYTTYYKRYIWKKRLFLKIAILATLPTKWPLVVNFPKRFW